MALKLLDILFPPKCVFCRKRIDEGYVCRDCASSLPRCGKIRGRGEFFSSVTAPFYYKDTVRGAILRYKFSRRRGYARGFAPFMAEKAREELEGEYDIITWVPVSRARLRKRGYDQSRLLAENTARLLGREAVPTLRKKRNTGANSSLEGREARAANVLGAFQVPDPETVRRRRVLLVDDIYTTGATLSECSRMLLMAGAEDVICLTLAAKPGSDRKY